MRQQELLAGVSLFLMKEIKVLLVWTREGWFASSPSIPGAKASSNDVLLMCHNCGSPKRDQSRSGVYAPTFYPLPSPQDLYAGKIQDPKHPSYLDFGVFAGAEVSEHQVVGFVVGVCRYVPGWVIRRLRTPPAEHVTYVAWTNRRFLKCLFGSCCWLLAI
jgi:hypothetical protein